MEHLSVGKGKCGKKAFYEELVRAARPSSIPIPGSRRMEPVAPLRLNPCPC